VVDDLLASEQSVVINVVLPAVLVRPEELIVGCLIWPGVRVSVVTQMPPRSLSCSNILNTVAVVARFVVWHNVIVNESRLIVGMVVLVRSLIEVAQLRDTCD